VPITADAKDWTWVLDRPCPECGFDSDSFAVDQVPRLLRENAASWHQVLTDRTDLARRPSDDRWSALEYACHVRDVLRLQDFRVNLMLTQDDPIFPNWDQDATAVADRYGEQDPARVDEELASAAETVAAGYDGLSEEQWRRTGGRSDGARFTVETFARYEIHDSVHHLYDVTGVVAS
jgi:DinB superfamily